MRWSALIGLLIASAAVAADPKPVDVKFGKLSATAPAGWKSEKVANRLRSHQFKLASPLKDFADAEVIAMPDSNPDPAKSFPRWKESFVPPEGKTADDSAKVSKFEVNGMTVHVLDITGSWKFKERPFDPSSKEVLKPEYRVIWAIVIVGDDATHLRLSGPMAVVEKFQPDFEKWIKSAK